MILKSDICVPICQGNATQFPRHTQDRVCSFKIIKNQNLSDLYTTQISIELLRIQKKFYITGYLM